MMLAERTMEETKYECSKCGKGFPRQHRLNKHMKTHTKPYKCLVSMPRATPDRCPAEFAEKKDLLRHRNTNHVRVDGPYKCPDCGEKLGRSDYVSRHLNESYRMRKGGKQAPCR
ncbi:hypothetical protein CSPX01_04491 [Colletotrichum filicis]|nr:hypothetical protein CSPX01_04491 [Colletotrichum filicis]